MRSNRQPPFQFKNVMNINDGNLVLKQQQVSLDASGEYLLEIASTSMKLEVIKNKYIQFRINCNIKLF